MNLIGLIIGVALLVVLGGGYAVTQNMGGTGMKDVVTSGQEAIDAAKDVVADANLKDAKMMAEEKLMDDASMMKKDVEQTWTKEEIDAMKNDESVMKKEEPAKGEVMMDDSAMMMHGSYEAYSPEKIAKAADGKVVLFFRASWCPSCKTVDADIRAKAMSIPKGVVILDVNYDDSAALKTKYGVTYQHTFVQVDAKGNQLAKWSGSPTLADIVSKLK